MNEELDAVLLSVPIDEWQLEECIIFDWYDGPREGVCALKSPKISFHFQLLDERSTKDDLDDRLFGLSSISPDALEQITGILSVLSPPVKRVWAPVWTFPTEGVQSNVERKIDAILATRQASEVVIYTRNMSEFLGRWKIKWHDANIGNWFSFLGL